MKLKWILVLCMATILVFPGCTRKEVPMANEMKPLSSVAAENEMQVYHDPETNTFQLGHTDPLFTLAPDQVEVKSGDSTIILPDPPRLTNGELYVSKASVDKLFSDPSVVSPSPETQQSLQGTPLPSEGIRSLSTVNVSNLIAFGKRFLGTPYHFAAGSYATSHTFDCSSFVQYVYGNFGIKLPRSSKDQSKVGTYVQRANLQAGDIIFFYTPGRYASNLIVGHVGIYIGNNQVLHTYGSPGVTITDLTKPNWSKRFLFARRVI